MLRFDEFFLLTNLPRWLGSLSLPWSLWAGKRRTLNSTIETVFDLTKFFRHHDFIRIRLSSAEEEQLGERIFSAESALTMISKPNRQSTAHCAWSSQLGLSSVCNALSFSQASLEQCAVVFLSSAVH